MSPSLLLWVTTFGVLFAAPVFGGDHDHQPAFGGMVLAAGDLHYEVVSNVEGVHQIYLSDARRKPLPASTLSEPKLTISRSDAPPEVLVFIRDAADTAWWVKGQPITATVFSAVLTFTHEGKVVTEELNPTETPAPHGGVLMPFGEGKAEIKTRRDGTYHVWLYDAQGVLLPVTDTRVRIRLDGHEDVVLVADGDHFIGRGPAHVVTRPVVVLVVDRGGHTITRRCVTYVDIDIDVHVHDDHDDDHDDDHHNHGYHKKKHRHGRVVVHDDIEVHDHHKHKHKHKYHGKGKKGKGKGKGKGKHR